MAFKDHFSTQSSTYATARPRYPAALYDWLAEHAPARGLAWDTGCGNGQASVALAERFERVIATDPSAAQIEHAKLHPNVEYRVEPAESPTLAEAGADLVTVAQALHWFDQARFHAAVRRVAKPGALFAAWMYAISRVDAGVDRVFDRLYADILGDFWPPERRHIESGYATLPMPFARVADVPDFAIDVAWTLPQYLDYLRSWSASERYRRERGEDAVSLVAGDMAAAWGNPDTPRTVRWPITLLAARVE